MNTPLCIKTSANRQHITFPPDSSNRVLSFMRVDSRWIGTERESQNANSARLIPVDADMSEGLDSIWARNVPA